MGSKDTKISLNHDHLTLLSDTSFFIQKRQVTERIIEMFGQLESEFALVIEKYAAALPEPVLRRRGKISRGENYRGLPYVILDYPAYFGKEGVFAFRSLLWWGHPLSFTFHLSGCYYDQYIDTFFAALPSFEKDFKICINHDQWEHHQEVTNFIPIHEFISGPGYSMDFFREKRFLKLSKTLPLQNHDALFESGVSFLESILSRINKIQPQ